MTETGIARPTPRALAAAALAAGLACGLAGPVQAQGQLWASWLLCAPDGTPNLAPVCQFDTGERPIFLSFTPDADITDVVGWSLVVDLASDTAPLPAWWQVQPDGCRSGQIAAGTPEFQDANCEDPWSATGAALVQSVIYPRPGGDSRQLRLVVGAGVPAGDAFTLLAGHTYLAAVLELRFAKTVSPDACAGCVEPVCIVFNSVEIARLPGAPGGPVPPIVTPGPGAANQVTWGFGSACNAVPAVRGTWGRLKTLYR